MPLQNEPTARTRGVRAVDRTLRILSLFATKPKVEWNLEEIATGVELPKSTTHRLLETLIAQRFVELGSRHGTYRLGLRAAVVGNAALQNRRPSEDVHAMLCAAAAEIGDGVGLSVLEGTDAVVVDRAASPRPLQWNLSVGGSLPARPPPARCSSQPFARTTSAVSTPMSRSSRARPRGASCRWTSCCCTSVESAVTASPWMTRSSRRACAASPSRCSTPPAA